MTPEVWRGLSLGVKIRYALLVVAASLPVLIAVTLVVLIALRAAGKR